jgi:hypothetical protein
MIRTLEQQRCGGTQLPETLLARHPDLLPLVLPSTADLDTYVAMVADEERIRGLTSSASVANRLNPQIRKSCRSCYRGQRH